MAAQSRSHLVILLVVDANMIERALYTAKQVRVCGQYDGDLSLVTDVPSAIRTSDARALRLDIVPAWTVVTRGRGRPRPPERCWVDGSHDSAHGRGRAAGWGGYHLKALAILSPVWASEGYERLVYMDAGMHVYNAIEPLAAAGAPGALVAHSDGYPLFRRHLASQFHCPPAGQRSAGLHGSKESGVCSSRALQACADLGRTFGPALSGDFFQSTIIILDLATSASGAAQAMAAALYERFGAVADGDQALLNLLTQTNGSGVIWRPLSLALTPAGGSKTTLGYDYHPRNGRPPWAYTALKTPDPRGERRPSPPRSWRRGSSCAHLHATP